MKKILIFYIFIAVHSYTPCEIGAIQNEQPEQPLHEKRAAVFKKADAVLAKVYKGTMTGYEDIDHRVVSLIRKVKSNPKKESPEELSLVREFYFFHFFEYMNRLKIVQKDKISESMGLWTAIYEEGEKFAKSDIRSFDWKIIKIIFARALLLASDEVTGDTLDVLGTISGTQFLFAAIEHTDDSFESCLRNLKNAGAVKGLKNLKIPTHISVETVVFIDELITEMGMPTSVYIPMVGLGNLGITAILKMWLEHVYPVPLTYGSYRAHGRDLGPIVGAIHDFAHGNVDNRRVAVLQAIINLIPAGKVEKSTIMLAAEHVLRRYLAINAIFQKYVSYKGDQLIAELKAVEDDDIRKLAKIKTAKQRYNVGIGSLFYALHEKYALTADVLGKHAFEGAIAAFFKNATLDQGVLVDLETLFNPKSDLSDEEIIEIIKDIPLRKIGIELCGTVGSYKDFDMSDPKVVRRDVHTVISFPYKSVASASKTITITTNAYKFDVYDDCNIMLQLIGQAVDKPDIDMAAMRELPIAHQERTLSKQKVVAWEIEIDSRLKKMMEDWVKDLISSPVADDIAAYDELLIAQKTKWLKQLKKGSGLRSLASFASGLNCLE